jgi:hypothetical protein
MSWNSGRLWSMALVPIPVAGLCVMCLVGQLGIDSSILAPVSFLAVRRPPGLRKTQTSDQSECGRLFWMIQP